MKRALLLLLLCAPLAAQTTITSSGAARRFIRVNGVPASCAAGDVMVDISVSPAVYYNCPVATPVAFGTGAGTVTSVALAGTANQITVTGTSPITSSGSWTLSFPAGGVTLPGTTTGTFSGGLTGNVTGNVSGSSGSTTGNAATATSATTATNATNTAITDDTTTNATVFPSWVTAATGNLPIKVSSTKLGFNPSTGDTTLSATSKLGWGSSGISTPDTLLMRDGAANTLAMKNSTTGQAIRFYNTDDGAGNTERGSLLWSSNVWLIQTGTTGTGTARDVNIGPAGVAAICLRTQATCRVTVGSGGDVTMSGGNSTGQCTLNGGATATCTHTVPSGCIPICTYNSGATPHTIACSVTTTTLTAVSATTLDGGTVNYHCF